VIRQRDVIPFREIARVAFKRYPHRAILCVALVIGQAFLYNAVTFDLGTILNGFFDVTSSNVPYYMVIFAVGNFLGPLLLGRLFDTVGRRPMIAGTYLLSAALTAVLGVMLTRGSLTAASFIALVAVTFFFASAGASSAYLTVSEVFPLETRALAIAFFFAVGTAIGGISGPAIFGNLIHSGDADKVALGFFIGAAVMSLGGLAEIAFGVPAERRSLEAIATPLTAEEVDGTAPEPEPRTPAAEAAHQERAERIRARNERIRERDRRGAGRYRPGVGSEFYSPGMMGTAGTPSRYRAAADRSTDREIDEIGRALEEHGRVSRAELERLVGGRSWGPGRFSAALRIAIDEGRAVRVTRNVHEPPRAESPTA
jgi:MFS family permease